VKPGTIEDILSPTKRAGRRHRQAGRRLRQEGYWVGHMIRKQKIFYSFFHFFRNSAFFFFESLVGFLVWIFGDFCQYHCG